MKIRVNYDLLEKIKDSKTGFLLKRTMKKCILASSISCFCGTIMHPTIFNSDNISVFLYMLIFNVIFNVPYDYHVLSQTNRLNAVNELKRLSKLLRGNYINTDYELLQEAYEYYTNYCFVLDEDKIPRLKQEKYIKVPVVDRDGEKEVSLVQEHLIGSKEYELSYGSPKKLLKLAYKPI